MPNVLGVPSVPSCVRPPVSPPCPKGFSSTPHRHTITAAESPFSRPTGALLLYTIPRSMTTSRRSTSTAPRYTPAVPGFTSTTTRSTSRSSFILTTSHSTSTPARSSSTAPRSTSIFAPSTTSISSPLPRTTSTTTRTTSPPSSPTKTTTSTSYSSLPTPPAAQTTTTTLPIPIPSHAGIRPNSPTFYVAILLPTFSVLALLSVLLWLWSRHKKRCRHRDHSSSTSSSSTHPFTATLGRDIATNTLNSSRVNAAMASYRRDAGSPSINPSTRNRGPWLVPDGMGAAAWRTSGVSSMSAGTARRIPYRGSGAPSWLSEADERGGEGGGMVDVDLNDNDRGRAERERVERERRGRRRGSVRAEDRLYVIDGDSNDGNDWMG